MNKKYDISNMKFGRLSVIEFAGINKDRRYIWKCKCDCGTIICASGKDLRSGNTKSCGCLNKEKLYESHKKFNKYDLSGEYGIGFTTKNEKFYFDLEDYYKIKNFSWYISKDKHVINRTKNKSIYLHRLIMDAADNYIVDHINKDSVDNRKRNLRLCCHQENIWNSKLDKRNKSGATGVYKDKNSDKWYAYITKNYKTKHLGTFNNKEEAIMARINAEILYYGEFAPQAHIRGDGD